MAKRKIFGQSFQKFENTKTKKKAANFGALIFGSMTLNEKTYKMILRRLYKKFLRLKTFMIQLTDSFDSRVC